MAGLLSGLGDLGLKGLENMDIYDNKEEKSAEGEENGKAPEVKEEDFLFDKTYECPVCDGTIKARTLKAGKVKLSHTDLDLRPVYEQVEPIKYDVIICPHCGYAALTRYFKGLTTGQIKAIRENISKAFKPVNEKKETYTYEEALNRYKLALANAIVKRGKASEKAYICLKAGWLLRSMQENMDRFEPCYEKKQKEAKVQEREFLKNALEGFISARESESYPMCGMDETTVEYLIGVLAMEFEQFDIASRLISGIIVSASANSRMKDKAREVKDMLIAKIKEKNAE